MSVISRLSKTLGFTSITGDSGITVIPLKGYSNSDQITPFAWLTRELLPDVMRMFVILDRDYRSDGAGISLEQAFAAENIVAHVWHRKELESYLLTPDVIARLAGSPVGKVGAIIDSVTTALKDHVFGRMLAERARVEVSAKRDLSVVMTEFSKEFELNWKDPLYRLYKSPAKDILSAVNRELQVGGYRTVTSRGLATAHRIEEIAPEMAGVLRRVEEAVEDARRP